MSIFGKLPKLKTSDQFEGAIAEALAEADAIGKQIEQQESKVKDAYFDPSLGEVAVLRKAIQDDKDRRDELVGLVQSLEIRRDAALNAEIAASVEKRAAEARKIASRMREHVLEVDESATSLAQAIQAWLADERALQEANSFVVKNGRKDLKTPHPIVLLKEHIGRQHIDIPQTVAGYLPPHPGGSLLQKLREIKL